MSFEAVERDPFEVFGDPEPKPAPELAPTITVANDVGPQPIKTGFSWAGFVGGFAALLWIGAAIGGPISYFGLDAVMRMDPAMQAGIVALAFGPALLFWLGAAAAGEALKARRLATELARLAQLAQIPHEVGENHAQRLTNSVKHEIDNLNDAVATALNRLAELETVAQRNAAIFDNAVAASRNNVEIMSHELQRERDALLELNGELRGQTEGMANTIGRQVRLMREASKLVKTEIGAAEQVLESHLTSFAASAGVMAERTAQFHQVADDASAATASLNCTMHNMLEGLGEATKLTDAARQSAHQAVHAANETASAVRETTQRAVVEAKRAAQLIRSETQAMQEAAAETLATLQSAAIAARAASEESQAIADRHATSIEKRLAALASTATARKPEPRKEAEERIVVRTPAPTPLPETETASIFAAANAAMHRSQRPQAEPANERGQRGFTGLKGLSSWGGFMPHRDEAPRTKPAPQPQTADAFDLVDFGTPRANPEAELKRDVIDMVISAGVDLDDSLTATDLDRIAQRSRNGAEARRQAVADAAPAAVNRIARHIKRNATAQQIATDFRARPDLAKSENKGEASDLVRSYLLVDAALD